MTPSYAASYQLQAVNVSSLKLQSHNVAPAFALGLFCLTRLDYCPSMVLLVIADFIAAALLAMLANWLGLIPWCRSADAHWTERARYLYPVRITARMNLMVIPALLFFAQQLIFPETSWLWWPGWMVAMLGSLLGCWPLEHTVQPQLKFRPWLRQSIGGLSLMLAMIGPFIVACWNMPAEPGLPTVLITAGYLVLHFALQCGLSLRLLKWLKYLRPADERLQSIVTDTAEKMSITARSAWLMETSQAQAYAFPVTRELAFSTALMEICTDEEIAAICAHELAHLSESRRVLAGRLASSLVFFPLIFVIPLVHVFGIPGLLVAYLGMFVIIRLAKMLSQRMEKRADTMAGATAAQAGVYAVALEKLYCHNRIPAVNLNNRQTHPHLYDRMLAAGVTPAYPRPGPPRLYTVVGWVYVIACGVLLGLVLARRG